MSLTNEVYKVYTEILREELVPALGCTEPTSIAFAAAKLRQVLGSMPEHVVIESSGNIIKNVKGAVVPNSGNLKGMEAAAAIGMVGGNPEAGLEVLLEVTPEDIEQAKALQDTGLFEIRVLRTPANLHIRMTAEGSGHTALVEIMHQHTNLVRIERDGEVILSVDCDPSDCNQSLTDRICLNIEDILDYADSVSLADVSEIIDRQVDYNTRISQEGLAHSYGAGVGANLLKHYGNDIKNRARAAAAAGSDARMSGCVFPVIINSGSGNQGMTASLPVIEYARHMSSTHEQLVRALVCSNLVAIHQKTGIGRLSAYCGAVSAACGSGAGITYLCGGGYDSVCNTITNTLANVAGIICDGAKPSCAAKIASAVDAAIMAHCLSQESEAFLPGDGIVKQNIEDTIGGVGEIASSGMRYTDEKILNIMVDSARR